MAQSTCVICALYGISVCFRTLSRTVRQVAHALLTRPPLKVGPKTNLPFDLNVLCTPPAFILSQDQTLDQLYQIILPDASISRACLSLFAYFCLSSILFRITRSCFTQLTVFFIRLFALYLSLCCSIFNDRSLPALANSFAIISQPFPFVNPFFSLFHFFIFLSCELSEASSLQVLFSRFCFRLHDSLLLSLSRLASASAARTPAADTVSPPPHRDSLPIIPLFPPLSTPLADIL